MYIYIIFLGGMVWDWADSVDRVRGGIFLPPLYPGLALTSPSGPILF